MIIRTLCDGRDVTELGSEVFLPLASVEGHNTLGLSTRPLRLATIDVLNGGAQGWQKPSRQGPPNAGGGIVVTGWPGEISMEAVATKTAGFALFFYRLLRDQCELA